MNVYYLQLRKLLSERYAAGEAQAIAFRVLEEAFGLSRTAIYADKGNEFSPADTALFENIARRLATGEPLQHVLGYEWFGERRFRVTSSTLIPRPETWELVEQAAALRLPAGARVLDAGTGSGCIAVSLALAHPEWEVEAWDVSPGALAVAKENARTPGAGNVRFELRDMLGADAFPNAPHYSLIVSNPPYVCEEERAGMERNVLDFEPGTALFVPDDDPLRFYKALARGARRSLLPGGGLMVEINERFGRDTAACFEAEGLTVAGILKDMCGKERFVTAFLDRKLSI